MHSYKFFFIIISNSYIHIDFVIADSAPEATFELQNLTPGIAIFSLSFISLFSGMLIAKDRKSSFILRLYTSPLSSKNFILGYALPFIPFSILQITICYVFAIIMGMSANINILVSILVIISSALMFIAIGLLCGSIFNDKQVGGVCGAILTNVCAFLSGTWISLDLMGHGFKAFAYLLPFAHSVDAGRLAIQGQYAKTLPHLIWVFGYMIVIFLISILVFKKNMNGDNV